MDKAEQIQKEKQIILFDTDLDWVDIEIGADVQYTEEELVLKYLAYHLRREPGEEDFFTTLLEKADKCASRTLKKLHNGLNMREANYYAKKANRIQKTSVTASKNHKLKGLSEYDIAETFKDDEDVKAYANEVYGLDEDRYLILLEEFLFDIKLSVNELSTRPKTLRHFQNWLLLAVDNWNKGKLKFKSKYYYERTHKQPARPPAWEQE